MGSGPDGDRGMETERLFALVDEAAGLGVERFYFTGGEPFYRRDVFEHVERVTRTHGRELRILTNGVLFHGAVLDRLREQDPGRLRLWLEVQTGQRLDGPGILTPLGADVWEERVAELVGR